MIIGTMFCCDICRVPLYPSDVYHGVDELGNDIEGCCGCVTAVDQNHIESSIVPERPLVIQSSGYMLRYDPMRNEKKWTAVAPGPTGRLGDFETADEAFGAILAERRMPSSVVRLLNQAKSLMTQLAHREVEATSRQQNVIGKCTRGYARSLVLAFQEAVDDCLNGG